MPYDGAFIFAEVNADVVTWEVDRRTYKQRVIDIEYNTVGWRLTTENVTGTGPAYVTENYKFTEGIWGKWSIS